LLSASDVLGESSVRVLVVDDERGLADDITEGLRDHGLAVDTVYDGLDAAAKINLYPYDVIVLDRDLPGLGGDALCRLVADTEHPAMVLMLTASGAPAERVAGLALGADDYLTKPFHFPELVLRLQALARRRPDVATRVLRAGDIELDPARRIATRGDRRLNLSAREFAVLEALLRASPGSLTAEQLLLRAWDENADPFTRTVYVTIARLKRKLGEPAPIHTTPGIGYRMSPAVDP
jgi:DNA-binding response OmpR family regulator